MLVGGNHWQVGVSGVYPRYEIEFEHEGLRVFVEPIIDASAIAALEVTTL